MGEVWLADDLLLNRPVAIKRLRSDPAHGIDDEVIARMEREARAAARVSHPRIVAIYDLVTANGQPHVVMEYVEGESLSDRIAATGPLSVAEAIHVIGQIAAGLSRAHRAQIIHRDIKPANILLTEDGDAKLADFGIARGPGDAQLTGDGAMVGTVAYMPPEVARTGKATPASDVWSLGATLYAAIEGHAPFADDRHPGSTQMLTRLITEPVPQATHAGAAAAVLSAMLAEDPAARPDAMEVVRQLTGIGGSVAHGSTDSRAETEPVAETIRRPQPPSERDQPTARRAPRQDDDADLTRRRPAARARSTNRRRMLLAAAVVLVASASAAALILQRANSTPTAAARTTATSRTADSEPAPSSSSTVPVTTAGQALFRGRKRTDPADDAPYPWFDITGVAATASTKFITVAVRFGHKISTREVLLLELDGDGNDKTGCKIDGVGSDTVVSVPIGGAGAVLGTPGPQCEPDNGSPLAHVGGTVQVAGRVAAITIPFNKISGLDRHGRFLVLSTSPTATTARIWDVAPDFGTPAFAIYELLGGASPATGRSVTEGAG